MAKRFIDTGLFDDEWFMELSKEGKILWIYFITKCDHAGLIHLNLKLASVQTGIKDLSTTIKELGNRLVTVKEQLYFIPKYISFQYPGFPNSNVRQQASAIELLLKYDLLDKTSLTVKQELANDYVYVNDNVPDTVKTQKAKKCLFENSEIYNYETFCNCMREYSGGKYREADMMYYYESVKSWSASKTPLRTDWMATAAGFMLSDIRDGKYKKKK